MNTDPIVVENIIDAPVSQVWNAITNKDEMKQWYFDIAEFELKKGFRFMFYGGDENKQYAHFCEIKEVIPEKKLSYTWSYENVPVETLVTFELSQEGPGKTKVKLTHSGVENFPADMPEYAKENFIGGWNHIIGKALPGYFEKNK